MGQKCTQKKESFLSKTVNFFATLAVASLIGSQVIGATGYNLKFAQVSDVHLATDEQNTSYKMLENSSELLKDVVTQLNQATGLDFVMFTGDMINKPKTSQIMEFLKIAKDIKTPWYVTIGNHDVDFDGKFTKKDLFTAISSHNLDFNETNPYYSFKKKGFKILAIDTMIDSRVTANGEIDSKQLEWIDKEIKETSEKDVIVIFSHVPVVEPYSSEHHKLLNSTEVLKHLYSYNRPIIWLSGHYHSTKVIQDGKLLFISSPSLISYPNAYRIVNINSQKDKVLVDLYFKETNLKDIKNRAKLRVIFSGLLEGEESDRSGSYELTR